MLQVLQKIFHTPTLPVLSKYCLLLSIRSKRKTNLKDQAHVAALTVTLHFLPQYRVKRGFATGTTITLAKLTIVISGFAWE